jgi:hypothetical protein
LGGSPSIRTGTTARLETLSSSGPTHRGRELAGERIHGAVDVLRTEAVLVAIFDEAFRAIDDEDAFARMRIFHCPAKQCRPECRYHKRGSPVDR